MVMLRKMINKESARPLERAVQFAADKSGMNDLDVAMLMTYFLEGIVDEVSRGHAVVIPGFGLFAPVRATYNCGPPTIDKTMPRCTPRFAAAQAFRNSVRWGCSPGMAKYETYQRYLSNHCRDTHVNRRSATALAALRQTISAQMRAQGRG